MARGNMPRRPSRSGRQDGRQDGRQEKPGAMAPPRPRPGGRSISRSTGRSTTIASKVSFGKSSKARSPKKKSASKYDPLAPERVRQIIAGLDQMYPGVTCALTHRSAWELLVATILSAQSTDVREHGHAQAV